MTSRKDQQRDKMLNLTPVKIIHILITLAIMLFFRLIPASAPLTPMGMEVLGVFIGMLYGWMVAKDSFWPSVLGMVLLGLSSYSTVSGVLKDGLGNSTVLLIFFFYAFTNIMNEAGLTSYIALWMVSRSFAQKKPYRMTLMIILATCAVMTMISATGAVMIIFPLIKQISKAYGYEAGEKWPAFTLVSSIYVGIIFYLILPFKSFPAVVFGNYETLSGQAMNLPPYLLIVVLMSLACVGVVFLLMRYVVKPDMSKIMNSNISKDCLPKLTRYQKFVFDYLIAVVASMLLPSFVPKTFAISRILGEMGNTGILAAWLGIYILLAPKDGLKPNGLFSKDVSWPMIFLMAAGMVIASAFTADATGILPWLVSVIKPVVNGHSPLIFAAIISLIGTILTQFSNNVATVAMLTPIVYAIGVACGINVQALLLCNMFACEMGMATPVASAPAAVIHGDKEWIPGNSAVKYGLYFCVANMILILAVVYPIGSALL